MGTPQSIRSDNGKSIFPSLFEVFHIKLNQTAPYSPQMHLGRKPCTYRHTALTKLFGKPECLLSNWKRTLTNYISAQPTELQVFTINVSDGEMADYIVLNDTRKWGRWVSRNLKKYQLFEEENKPNSMKCGFKTDKSLTAMKETDHTMTL